MPRPELKYIKYNIELLQKSIPGLRNTMALKNVGNVHAQ
jgi:hypothetical protein